MVHTKPFELLLPAKKLSKATEKMIKYFTECVPLDTVSAHETYSVFAIFAC